jgi:hypothetical protein
MSAALALFNKARDEGRLSMFVPASGAASRMFRALMGYRARRGDVRRERLEEDLRSGDPDAGEILDFARGLPLFPFYDDLRAALRTKGLDPAALISDGVYTPWVDLLLSPEGLNLAAAPKALMPFHRVKEGVRTPLEEQLLESADTLRSADGLCRVHVTASPEHAAAFRDRLGEILPRVERLRRCRFDAAVSIQDPSTDTLGLGADGFPARGPNGRLLFRPAGHGALLKNLNEAKGDIVFIRNIDNVPHESHPGEGSRWDALLAGILLDVQSHLFQRVALLAGRPKDDRLLEEAEEFAERRLNIRLPPGHAERRAPERRKWLLARFNRPVRVCAVVENRGEPGGGPFWVRGGDGGASPQIIEAAQVADDPAQRLIFRSATHFNPVQMVVGLRDHRGRNYDLAAFADPDAAFTADKSVGGKPVKVLERPGLWNGGMARWTTLFVEAPLSVFHPVKTVNDLLRPDHQPA